MQCEHREVVGAVGRDPLDQLVDQVTEVGAGTARDAEAFEPDVEVLVAAFDEPVGERHERGAFGQGHGHRLVLTPAEEADRGSQRGVEEAAPRRLDDQQVGVSSSRHHHRRVVDVDQTADDRGEQLVAGDVHQEAQLVEDVGRRRALERVGAHRVAQRGHGGRGLDATPGHVADGEQQPPRRERQEVVPVAADLGAGHARFVAHRRPSRPATVGSSCGRRLRCSVYATFALFGVEAAVLVGDGLEPRHEDLSVLAPPDQVLGQHPGGRGDDEAQSRGGSRDAASRPPPRFGAG